MRMALIVRSGRFWAGVGDQVGVPVTVGVIVNVPVGVMGVTKNVPVGVGVGTKTVPVGVKGGGVGELGGPPGGFWWKRFSPSQGVGRKGNVFGSGRSLASTLSPTP